MISVASDIYIFLELAISKDTIHAISPRSPRGLRLCEVFPLCFLALGLRVLRANLG